jgi:mRNA interferase RelE/StbE
MITYKVVFARSARRELDALEDSLASAIFKKIESLESDLYPRGVKKIRGTRRSLWRVRSGDFRIIYEIHASERIVDIVAIRHRSEAYR